MIKLNYPDMAFDEQDLIDFIKASGKNFIIQGQQKGNYESHTKPASFDVWLRNRFPEKRYMKLTDNYVINLLVATGNFTVAKDKCPKTGRLCKSIRLA